MIIDQEKVEMKKKRLLVKGGVRVVDNWLSAVTACGVPCTQSTRVRNNAYFSSVTIILLCS